MEVCILIELAQLWLCGLQWLQEAVEKEQEYVSSLQNMVVVVDENNSDEGNFFESYCNY